MPCGSGLLPGANPNTPPRTTPAGNVTLRSTEAGPAPEVKVSHGEGSQTGAGVGVGAGVGTGAGVGGGGASPGTDPVAPGTSSDPPHPVNSAAAEKRPNPSALRRDIWTMTDLLLLSWAGALRRNVGSD